MSLSGRRLSHYLIGDEISRGGMGVVYRATDSRLSRDIALKVLPPELVADPERKQRFVLEARAASALEHPNIAVIHDIGEEDGISFIAMELVRGGKLSVVLQAGPLPPTRALEVAAEIAEGLARAHSQGIVHRDLKPANDADRRRPRQGDRLRARQADPAARRRDHCRHVRRRG